MRLRLVCRQDIYTSRVFHTRAKVTYVTLDVFSYEKLWPSFDVATRSFKQCQVRERACHPQRGFVEVAIWGRQRMKSTCSLSVQIHRKLGNTFVQPCPSPTLIVLLSSCRLQTQSPWPSLWHVANTRGKSIFHDLPFV